MFVPTNAAFASLPAGALDDLVKNTTKLANLLKYHLYSGDVKYSASMVQAEQSIMTAQGSALVITPEVGRSIKIRNSRYRLKVKTSYGHAIALWKKRCGIDQKRLII